jgi:hypothetical protein
MFVPAATRRPAFGRVVLILLGLAVAAGIFAPQGAQAARLQTGGFEEQTAFTLGCSGVTATSTKFHSGSWSGNFKESGNSITCSTILATPASNGSTYYFREYFYFTSHSSGRTAFIGMSSGSGQRSAGCAIEANGKMSALSPTSTLTGTYVASTGQWYRMEGKVIAQDTAFTGEVACNLYLGDSSSAVDVVDMTSVKTVGVAEPQYALIMFGTALAAGTANFNLDEIAFNDDTGGFQNSYPGPGNIALMQPASDPRGRSGGFPLVHR